MLRSLQARTVLIYLLVILIASQVMGFILLRSLQNYYLNSLRDSLTGQARLLASFLDQSLSGGAKPSDIRRVSAEFNRQLGTSLYVLDRTGVVIYASDEPDLVGDRLVRDEVTRALGGVSGEAVRRDASGLRRFYVAVPASGENDLVGVVYVAGSLDRTDAVLRDIRAILLAATAGAMICAAALALALGKTITGPIAELTTRAQALAGGNFTEPIEIRSDDEIGRLGGMFNHMAERLSDTLSQLRAENERVEAILSRLTDGILAFDLSGRVTFANPALCRMLGTTEEQIQGRPWSEAFGDLSAQVEADIGRLLDGREIRQGRDIERGTSLLRLRGAQLKGSDGEPSGAFLVLHDVTEQEKLDSLRREFAANVSHELRTPLTSMKSYLETLLDDSIDDPETRREFLTVAARETDRMARLVRDLMRLAQLDQRRHQLEPRPVNMAALLDEVMQSLRLQADRKGLRVEVRADRTLPPVEVDEAQMGQVFYNLLANAIEFTPSGGRVELGASLKGRRLQAWVSDTGVGIPAEDIPRIFERFYRVDKARSRELGGTGLGLAIAKQIVELHGGEIRLESQVGKGTRVIVNLPLRREAS